MDEFYIYVVFMLVAISMALYTQLLKGELAILYNRLAFNDNIRDLADVTAIPAFVSFAYLLLGKGDIKQKIIYVVVGVVSSSLLLMTLSKGALIATIVSILIVFIKGGNKKSILYLALFAAFAFFIFNYVSNLDMFGVGRLTEEDEGFSGRTDIWQLYYDKMMTSGIHSIFGFGPGELQRLNYSEFYAHSAFLDVFFSYGLAMSLVLGLMLIYIFISIYKSKNTFALALFVFSCLLFTTHGVCTNHQIYILIGISMALAKSPNNETSSIFK